MDTNTQDRERMMKLANDPEIKAQAERLEQTIYDQAEIDCPFSGDMDVNVFNLALERACLSLAICEHDKNAAQKPLQQLEAMLPNHPNIGGCKPEVYAYHRLGECRFQYAPTLADAIQKAFDHWQIAKNAHELKETEQKAAEYAFYEHAARGSDVIAETMRNAG